MASSFKSPILQAIDQNGDPVPGAKLFVFASGTTTPVAVFSNQALTVALPNPVIANARGYFASAGGVVGNIFWNGQALRLRLTDPADAVIWEINNYTARADSSPLLPVLKALEGASDPNTIAEGDVTAIETDAVNLNDGLYRLTFAVTLFTGAEADRYQCSITSQRDAGSQIPRVACDNSLGGSASGTITASRTVSLTKGSYIFRLIVRQLGDSPVGLIRRDSNNRSTFLMVERLGVD